MVKGILYVMSTAVDGVVKIGRTENEKSYKDRMRILSKGYNNISKLNKEFAIEVENYIEKEKLLQRVLNSCRIGKSELFSLDVEAAVQLLSAFNGKIIYPKNNNRESEEVFLEVTENLESNNPMYEADSEKDSEKKASQNKFKETHFSSSLTNKRYYFPTIIGPLKVYDEESNKEIESYSEPSKKQILKQAVIDLKKNNLPGNFEKKTLYELAHMLEKLVGGEKTN